MPTVGSKTYSYTPKGVRDARKKAKKTGKKVTYSKKKR